MHTSIEIARSKTRLLRHAVTNRIVGEVRQWANPVSNPFLQKELRRSSRRGGFRSLAIWTWLSILFFNAAGWLIWIGVRASDGSLEAQFPSLQKLPPYLGTNPILFSVLLSTAACSCVALAVAPFSNPLQREVLEGTIDQLRLIPQPEERWLWMTRAYPAFRAFTVWCHGLPIFALAVFLDQLSVLDLLGLLLLFISLRAYPNRLS